jgi:hypothetical protein
MKISTCWQVAVLAMAGMMCSTAAAEDHGWDHTLAVYLVAASIDGKAGAGPLEADVDVGFDDILDNLDWGLMGAYRGERGPWAIGLDVQYLAVESDVAGLGPNEGTRLEVEGDQLIVQLDGGYALTDSLSAYAGARFWRVDSDVTIRSGGPLGQVLTAGRTEDWIDPVIGLRYAAPLSERWLFVAKGDIGGFGVGSDFSWHVTVFAAWRATQRGHLILGYRHIDVDYDDGSGADRFLWDLALGGPTVGFAWRF